MVPVVGQNCQFFLKAGDEAMAALICFVHNPVTVTVAYWLNTGLPDKLQNVAFVAPGTTPPKGPHVTPMPGGPIPAPAVKP